MKNILLVLMGCVILFACKKKDKDVDPVPTTTSGGIIVDNTKYDGFLTAGTYTTTTPSFGSASGFQARAFFNNKSESYIDQSHAITVNKVLLNGDSLTFDNSQNTYRTYHEPELTTETWSVSGANGIPSFSFTNTQAFPGESDYSEIPDTVKKSKGFSFKLNNLTNVKSGKVMVSDMTGNMAGFFSVPVVNGNNNVSITSANLSSMSTTTFGIIIVVLENYQKVSFSGKDIKFTREAQFARYITIEP